jgi:serine/threonine protein kinase
MIGRVFEGRFRVEAFIAAGSTGAVYRAWDLKRAVPVAMKVLHADLVDDPTMLRHFKREAEALLKLSHPNIVPFYGFYQTPELAFLLERFVDGHTLSEVVHERQGRPMPVQEALVHIKGVSAALGYAHANGVVHCDVKPGNIMLDKRGNFYLMDFGIARQTESSTMSMGGAGTPAYMAPEQVRREAVSAATDVYALGVVLYELLTGRRPFTGSEPGSEAAGDSTNVRIRYAHLHLAPPDPHSLNPAIPPGLNALLLQTLSKRPEARPASAQAFFNAACAAAGIFSAALPDRLGAPATPPRSEAQTVQPARPRPPERSQPPARPKPAPLQRRPNQVMLFLVIGVTVLVVFGLALTLGNAGPSSTSSGPSAPMTLVIPTDTDFYPVVPPAPTDTPGQAPTPSLPPLPTLVTPAQGADLSGSFQRFEDLAVQKYTAADYLRVPGYFTYSLLIHPSMTLLWGFSWCASDQARLDENLGGMDIQYSMNGQAVPAGRFRQTYEDGPGGQKCVTYLVEVKNWTEGEYQALTVLTFRNALSDGMSTFPAGQQVYQYQITVVK